MATIYNTVVDPGGAPLRGLSVTIELSYDVDGNPPSVSSQELMIHRTYTAETDINGYWEADVVPNDLIEPAGTVYKISESDEVFYVEVTDGATPTFWVGSILASTPAWEV